MASPLISSLSLPLILGSFDPSGASNLPADAVICAQLGLHAGSVVTALLAQDTSGIQSIQRISPEFIDEQARCLLEDMAIGAIKIGPQYDPETIATLAQLAADYSTLPLVLHLAPPPDVPDLDDLDAEDTAGALLDLLVPQARILVLDASLPEQWASQGLLSGTGADTPIQALLELGASHVLCCHFSPGTDGPGLRWHSQDQSSRRWPLPASPVRATDRESLLATLLTYHLAQGLTPEAAVQQAAGQAGHMLAHAFHPGMGQQILRFTTP